MIQKRVILVADAIDGVGQALAELVLVQDYAIVLLASDKDALDAYYEKIVHQLPDCAQDILTIPFDFLQVNTFDNLRMLIEGRFGRLDALINNLDLMDFGGIRSLSSQNFDILQCFNMRLPYFLSKAMLPLLSRSKGKGHIVNISPPLSGQADALQGCFPYSLSKHAMSLRTVGLSWEFFFDDVAVNSIWPRVLIDSPALQSLPTYDMIHRHLRKPKILAEAILSLIDKPTKACTGNFLLDDLVLESEGITDFMSYLNDPQTPYLIQNMFVPDDALKGLYQVIPLEKILLHTL